ncbi:MAG: helix-turn-helix domain-containing protein [Woeseiaceae bacterium]
MSIRVNLDVEMARQKMSLNELAERVGISTTNLSLLKNGKVKAIRFNTLASICAILQCSAGDILEFVDDGQEH